jgi:TonB family protein
MTLHETFFEWSQWLWPSLANHLWQTTLIAAIAWIVVLLVRRAPARPRHLIWLIALVKFVVPSALLILASESCGIDISRPPAGTSVEIFFQIAQPVSAVDSDGVKISEPSPVASPDGLVRQMGHSEIYCLLTNFWLLGSLACLARWLLLRRRFARALKAGSEISDGPETVALCRASAWLSLTRQVRLIESSEVCQPGVWRTWRPVVVLPKGLAGKLSAQELEAVMMHELVHVKRLDNFLGTMQMLICCLFWFHPLVWLIDRRLLSEREMVCDEDVISYLGEPRVYAESLWKVARFGLGWNLAGVSRAAGSNLKRRIELMLDAKYVTKLSIAGRAVAASAVLALLVFAFALAIFTRDKVEASKISAEISAGSPARQDRGQAVVVPMLFENMPDIPLIVTELQASLGEARPVKFPGVTPDGQIVDLTRKDELERDLNLSVKLFNQSDRIISGIAIQILNPTLWHGEGMDGMLFQSAALSERESGQFINIEPKETFTLNRRESINERINGVELMNSITDFRFRIVGVMFEPDKTWVWANRDGRHSFDYYTVAQDNQVVDSLNSTKVARSTIKEIPKLKPQEKTESSDTIEPMSAVLRPTILYKERAKYTDQARQNEIQGTVVLNVIFRADGRITDLRVIRGLPDGLTDQAIAATQVIRFEPAIKNGQRVSVRGNLEFSFNLDKSAESGTAGEIRQMSAVLRPTILYKEKAVYTEEARNNQIAGQVVLKAIFGADGRIGNIQVVQGLPYGLTEQAIKAAQAIRFEPAMIDGKPVSVRGNLEFTFKLY